MRTTVKIDYDVLHAARRIAAAEGKDIEKAVSELARRGLAFQSQSKAGSGFPVFDVPPNAPPITLELVRAALGED